ncbi:gluconolaconase [Pseudomonas amygdali pv. morsprunorum]|nr:gluconolaconase [Pseudomonas amygdali pv. morsprunorum]PPS36209.1 gluconolaconase [Pseudomonas amygdali pv. morsprunorum]
MHRKSICAALAILSAATLTTSLAYGATITGLPASAPADRSVGKLEQVHAFYDAMPTGVTVTETGRIFVNFPRWGDKVPFTVGEIREGKVVAYPDLAVNHENPKDPGDGLISVQSVVADGKGRVWLLDTADPDFVPVVEGVPVLGDGPDGSRKPVHVAADGIALSADGKTLYFSPLSSRHLYSVATELLNDSGVSEQQLAAAVEDLGEKGASDGLEADADGAVYAGDYEHNAIRKRLPSGNWQTVAHDPRMLWPDTLSIGPDGYLYFIVNQLHRQAGFNSGHDKRAKPYSLLRVKVDAAPAPTH